MTRSNETAEASATPINQQEVCCLLDEVRKKKNLLQLPAAEVLAIESVIELNLMEPLFHISVLFT